MDRNVIKKTLIFQDIIPEESEEESMDHEFEKFIRVCIHFNNMWISIYKNIKNVLA